VPVGAVASRDLVVGKACVLKQILIEAAKLVTQPDRQLHAIAAARCGSCRREHVVAESAIQSAAAKG
jgi:hypothetical protein